MQLTQSIPSNFYVKGASNNIIFIVYISCAINLVNSQRLSWKTHYALYRWKEGVGPMQKMRIKFKHLGIVALSRTLRNLVLKSWNLAWCYVMVVPCRGKKNWPNRNKFWYKLLANRSFSQEGSWFWEGTCHLCVHNSNLKYKHMFQCTKVGWKFTCVSFGACLGTMQEMGMNFRHRGTVDCRQNFEMPRF